MPNFDQILGLRQFYYKKLLDLGASWNYNPSPDTDYKLLIKPVISRIQKLNSNADLTYKLMPILDNIEYPFEFQKQVENIQKGIQFLMTDHEELYGESETIVSS